MPTWVVALRMRRPRPVLVVRPGEAKAAMRPLVASRAGAVPCLDPLAPTSLAKIPRKKVGTLGVRVLIIPLSPPNRRAREQQSARRR